MSTETPAPKVDEVLDQPKVYGIGLGTDMVDVLVGPEKVLFRVHKNLLCVRVPVFDRMFNGGFREAMEQRAELPEDDSRMFSHFVEWLYTNQIAELCDKAPAESIGWDHIKLYCFAEKYCQSELMDFVMSHFLAFLQRREGTLSFDGTAYIYEHTALDSPMRRYAMRSLVMVAAKRNNAGWTTEKMSDLLSSSRDLIKDYLDVTRKVDQEGAGAKAEAADRENLGKLGPCFFHIHGKDVACSVKMVL